MVEYKNLQDLTAEDIEASAELAAEFHAESHQAQFSTYAPNKFKETIEAIKQNAFGYMAFDKEKCVGFLIFNISTEYIEEWIAELAIMYIHKNYRKFQVADELMEKNLALLNRCKSAVAVYIESTAGFDDGGKNARAFRFWGHRHGFKPIGDIKTSLYKKLDGGLRISNSG